MVGVCEFMWWSGPVTQGWRTLLLVRLLDHDRTFYYV